MNLFVPGRICLLGEHSDWAGGYRRINADIEKGYSLITGTDQGIYAEVFPHPTSLILTSTTPDGERHGPYEIPMEPKRLMEEAQKGGFWSYIAGVAYQALVHYHVRGLVINNTKTDLPVKKGLSSSAAICVLAARAFNRVYDLKLTVRGEMEMAYQGEITTPSRCGRLDQGCAFGNRPVLMTFDGDRLETEELRVNEPLFFVLVDLQAKKDTMEILNRLNRSYPFAENEVERGVQELLGPINKRIVHQGMEALKHADAPRLGALLTEAQAFFDRYATPACPEELTSPVLHRILEYAPLQPHVWGGKGVGSQGDGTGQFLCRSEADQQAVIEILQRDLGMPGYPLTITPQQRVRKAIIPAAGFGTRMFPASKATKKELFPVVDRDGIAVQTAQEGFGHAVYCVREMIGDEPFLLMLGDHIYRATGEVSCARQLLDAYQRHGTSLVGLRATPEDLISNFGTVTGVWVQDEKVLNVTEFAEKPTLDYARTNLRVPGIPDGEYLTVFGQYILKPKLFDFLHEHITHNVRERGEFQLTSALDRLRQEDGFLGLMMDGTRFDIGIPQVYLETLQKFRA